MQVSKIFTSGMLSRLPELSVSVHQYVSVDGNVIRFGHKDNGRGSDTSIDLRTGVYRLGSQLGRCTETRR